MDFEKFYTVIDGVNRSAGTFHQGINPATGEKLWDVPTATEKDLNDAVAAATKAGKEWAKRPKTERDQCMAKFLESYEKHQEQITKLLCKETGKTPIWGGSEVEHAKAWFSWSSSVPLPDETIEEEGRTLKYVYKPLGVVGCIVPWNYPLLLAAGKLGPALSAGNTVVVKPSPFTPYTSTKVIELMQQFYPPGVINTLSGDEKLGPWMTAHPDIAKISFTGSIATGKRIMAACASTLKRVTLELGGNDAAIVLPDADPALAGRELAMGAFQNTGQVCIASKRIYVHKSIYEPFLKSMVDFTKKLRVSSTDPLSMLGPIQNPMQYEKVKQMFKDVEEKGYKIAGTKEGDIPSEGFFMRPTVVENPPDDSLIVTQEPFGPIVPVLSYETVEEALERANNDTTGLGGSVWGTDLEEAQRVADQLETGSVWINSFSAPGPHIYFPPWKQSGIGGEWGKKGLADMCRIQVQHVWKQPLRATDKLPPQL